VKDLPDDDRERLERYLEWDRAKRSEARRQRRYVSAAVLAGVVVVMVAAWLVRGGGERQNMPVRQPPPEVVHDSEATAADTAPSASVADRPAPPLAHRGETQEPQRNTRASGTDERTRPVPRVRDDARPSPRESARRARDVTAAAPRATARPSTVHAARVQSERSSRLQKLKRWARSMPEVRIDKALARWVKSLPPPHPRPPADPMPTQAR
jgi:hypothetical protein